MPRIFIAAFLPEDIQRKISKLLLNADESFSGVRWEKPDKIHITLKFIGSVEDKTKDEILGRIKIISKRIQPITLRFSHIDAFPNFRKPRVLVLRLSKSKDLIDIFRLIEDELLELGIEKEERNFIPHVTLGRINKVFRVKEKKLKLPKNEFVVEQIAVVNSKLKREGSEYNNLGVYNLS